MCIVAGIIGAGVAGAGATAFAGSQAASATTNASNASISEQNKILGQQQTLSAPYQSIGTTGGAISQYESLLGLGSGGSAGIQQTLANTPGYQFAKSQGLSSTENQATAMGLGLSGNTLEGLDQFSTGLADSTYQQAVGNSQNAVGIGQAAAAGQAANLGSAGANISSTLTNQGNTIAGIDANTVAGITKAGSSAVNQSIIANTLAGLGGNGNSYQAIGP